MNKTVYIIPGYSETTSLKRYKGVLKNFHSAGFKVVEVRIRWKGTTMAKYVERFLKEYNPQPGSYVFGFSFGAMVAFIAAPVVKPKAIVLCSLSPYFKEDLPASKRKFGKKLYKYFRKEDIQDLENYSFNKIVKNVKARTILFAGTKEPEILLNRVRDANAKMKKSKLVLAEGAKHDIAHPSYALELEKTILSLK